MGDDDIEPVFPEETGQSQDTADFHAAKMRLLKEQHPVATRPAYNFFAPGTL